MAERVCREVGVPLTMAIGGLGVVPESEEGVWRPIPASGATDELSVLFSVTAAPLPVVKSPFVPKGVFLLGVSAVGRT